MILIKINYQLELESILNSIDTDKYVPTLLLHSCCGPCSSYILEYLSSYFRITVFYYNPNIYPSEEYWFRVEEQQKIIDLTNAKYPINMISGKYETDRFYDLVRGLEDLKEGGERCKKCYELRLLEAAKICKSEGFDYFTTTLSISPHKNSQVLNEIGNKVADKIGVRHLPADFKKNNGYKRSCEITRQHGMYRQEYCGCVFSKKEMEERIRQKEEREKIQEQKSILRKKLIDIANSLDPDYIKKADDEIIKRLLNSDEYKNADTIFTYIGRDREINTKIFIEKAILDNKKICIPYCVNDKKMEAYLFEGFDSLVESSYGILEPNPKTSIKVDPKDIDLIIVPQCGASRNGKRLGFGKGYYDRFLSKLNIDKIMLVRERQLLDDLITTDLDVCIEHIITEKNTLRP